MNLDKEWEEIQHMLNVGIIPSMQRIKEYLLICYQRQDFHPEIDDKVFGCLVDILRLEEERASQTEPAIREFLFFF